MVAHLTRNDTQELTNSSLDFRQAPAAEESPVKKEKKDKKEKKEKKEKKSKA